VELLEGGGEGEEEGQEEGGGVFGEGERGDDGDGDGVRGGEVVAEGVKLWEGWWVGWGK